MPFTEATARRKEKIIVRPPPLPPPPFLKSLSSSQIEEARFITSSSTVIDERIHPNTFCPPPPHSILPSSLLGADHSTARRRSGPITAATPHRDNSNKRNNGFSYRSSPTQQQHQQLPKMSPRREGGKNRSRRRSTIPLILFDLIATPLTSLVSIRNFATTIAVVLWYLLGVLSISTTKVLLSTMNVRPLWLSVQQFIFGSLFLNLLLEYRLMSAVGKQPLPKLRGKSNSVREYESSDPFVELILTALFFGFGFVATNYSFKLGAASFVETVKASEPITSAIVAVAYGVDTVSLDEGISLLGIVSGVLISTLGSYLVQSQNTSTYIESTSPSIVSSLSSCCIVMVSNLCFSFRGVHQKLLRSTNSGSSQMMDDVNLQFRIQCISALIFFFPSLMFDVPGIIRSIWRAAISEEGLIFNRALTQYVGLSLVNGFAFVSYNLASTYVLTRLAVVHHAALNCVRRIFAIVVTSLIFQVPIGAIGILGILTSFTSFVFYTRFKLQRQNKPRPVSSLLPMSAV